jgi:hypothetical protein
MINNKKYIWVIGCPRSGTTFLTDYIGKHTDLIYNEPFATHPIEEYKKWSFPEFETMVFKYCVNWKNASYLFDNFKDSFFLHIYRCPKNTVYSLTISKNNSYPFRDFYESKFLSKISKKNLNIDDKFDLSIKKWYKNTTNSFSVIKKYNGINIKYEKIQGCLKKISNYLKINLKEDIKFENRNNKDTDSEIMNYFEHKWKSKNYYKEMELRKKIDSFL